MSEPWNPHAYQLEGVKHLLENANCGLFFDPGCGKTSCVFAAIKVLKAEKMFRRALVVAPLRVATEVWPAEQEKWADFADISVTVLHGPKKQTLVDQLSASVADIVTVTPEGLTWLTNDDGHRMRSLNPDVLVVDESSYFRHYNTQRFKSIRKILTAFKRRIILTGTPAPRGYEDLWAQAYIMDRGGALEPFVSHYRMKYFVNVGRDYDDWKVRTECIPLIDDKLRPYVLRGDALDHLDLPDLLYNTVRVDLPPDARKTYDEMEEHFIAALPDGDEVMTPTAATMGQKLRQICGGFVYDGDKLAHILHAEKISALTRLLDELQGQRALILYEFVADRDRIEAALRRMPVEVKSLDDATTPSKLKEMLDGFNRGEFHLLSHPKSVGHGLNLQQHSQHVVWFGPTWDCELHQQAIARVWRQGNPHEHVTVHTLVATHSIDERVASVLAQKDATQRRLLAAMKRNPSAVAAQ
jgi:SNF2 family DNA or RNA helicase